jgi:hypothetical protein
VDRKTVKSNVLTRAGLPETGKIYQKYHTIYQMAIKYTNWMQNLPNDHKIAAFSCPMPSIHSIPSNRGIFGTKYTNCQPLSRDFLVKLLKLSLK